MTDFMQIREFGILLGFIIGWHNLNNVRHTDEARKKTVLVRIDSKEERKD